MINYSVEAKNNTIVDVKQRKLILEDEEWFIKEFVRSFLFVYGNKVFYISSNDKDLLLGLKNIQEKEKWLIEAAQDDFDHYVTNPQPGYKALAGFIDSSPVGIILYRELKEERILYLAQGFVVPEYQKKGIGSSLLEKLLEKMEQDYDEFHVLTRHQNDAAIMLYNQLGFSVGTTEIVEKYGYNPMRYISFIKQSPQRKNIFNIKNIEHTELGAQNEEWFRTQMKDIYKSTYDKKSLLIKKSNGTVSLGTDSFAEKEEWINETIENCLNNFFINPKSEFKSIVFNYKDQPIACFLFEVNNDTIYVVEAFVIEEYRSKGLFKLFINTISSYKNIGVRNIIINVRHQNETMLQCVSKMGFYVNAESSTTYYVSMQKNVENFEVRKISARGIQFLDIKSDDHEWLKINYVKQFLNAFNRRILFTQNEGNKNPLILKNEGLKNKYATRLVNKYLNENTIRGQIVWKNSEKIGAIFFKLDTTNHSLSILDLFTVDAEILQNILSDFVKHSKSNTDIKAINTVVDHQNERLIEALINTNFQMGNNMVLNDYYNPLYQKFFYFS